jgi:hypothetical protein
MKLGYVHAMTALLLGGGALLAQAPLPVEHDTPVHPQTTTSSTRTSGVVPVQYSSAPAPAPAPGPAPLAGPEFNPEPAHQSDCSATHPYLDNSCGYNGCLVYGSTDYLLWRISKTSVPSIANTVPVGVLTITTSETNVDATGVTVGTGINTVTHFFPVSITANTNVAGTNPVDPGSFSGGRVTAGFWFDSEHTCGVEASGFALERLGFNFTNVTNNANNQFIINTPFTNNVFQVAPAMGSTPATRTLVESFPVFFVRQANESLVGETHTQMWGAEASLRSTWCYYGPIAIGGTIGPRYQNFEDELQVNNTFTLVRPTGLPSQGGPNGDPPTGGGPSLGNPLTFATHDQVEAHNHWIGGQVGLDLDAIFGRFIVHVRGEVGMGDMYQVVDVFSQTSNNDPRAGGTTPGGLLFGQNDSGQHTRSEISFLSELNLKVGYAVTRNLQVYAGYDVMYITNVARAANQSALTTGTVEANVAGTNVNLNVNSPTFRFSDSGLWASGFNVGVELAF